MTQWRVLYDIINCGPDLRDRRYDDVSETGAFLGDRAFPHRRGRGANEILHHIQTDCRCDYGLRRNRRNPVSDAVRMMVYNGPDRHMNGIRLKEMGDQILEKQKVN